MNLEKMEHVTITNANYKKTLFQQILCCLRLHVRPLQPSGVINGYQSYYCSCCGITFVDLDMIIEDPSMTV